MESASWKRSALFWIRSESSLWTRLTARGNSVYSASGAESAELLPCASLGAATAFESSGPDIGAKASNFMKKRTAKYADDKGEIIGELHRVRDELPSIDELTGKSGRQTKVTLALDNDALSFFKREARRRNTSYQRMIRNLVRAYSQAHRAASAPSTR
jgi:hypothetical protein